MRLKVPLLHMSDEKENVKSLVCYIVVMQHFRVVYSEISHDSLVFSRYTHGPLGKCVYLIMYFSILVLHLSTLYFSPYFLSVLSRKLAD